MGHVVRTAYQQGWDALANGELLRKAEEAGFDVLLTTDKNLVSTKSDRPQDCRRGAGEKQVEYREAIRGLRVTVWDVLDMLASGMTEEEILRDYRTWRRLTSPPSMPTLRRQGGSACRVEAFV